MKVKIKANAKLNLTLSVTGMYDKNYHALAGVSVTVDIFDTVCVTPRADKTVSLVVNGQKEDRNAALKVAQAVVERFGTKGVDIAVDKKIAVMGGMGGSSADAAAVLAAMSGLYGLPLDKKMYSIASEFGSDIAYLLRGGLALISGKGDGLVFFDTPQLYFTVITGPRLDTKDVFSEYDKQPDRSAFDNSALINALSSGDILGAREKLGNGLQSAAARLSPEIAKIASVCSESGLPRPVMTGSGGNMFILCLAQEEADSVGRRLRAEGLAAQSCRSTPRALEIT